MRPNDTLYDSQWHLRLIGDIEKIWDDYIGRNVHVGVYDTGVDLTHPDLAPNYDASRGIVYNGVLYDGASLSAHPHGTAVAGLIAAAGNNGTGGVGVAWGSSITGVGFIDEMSPVSGSGWYTALAQMTNFDVVNSSWNLKESGFYSRNESYLRLYEAAVANGRNGLGTIIVQAGGNNYWTAEASSFNNWRQTITVGGVLQSGDRSLYSNVGSNILVTAPASAIPGSIITTDLKGAEGYSDGDYTRTFNGTSAATPIVSGIVALMLEANAGLGWRDVQDILALSAVHTGSAIGSTTRGASEAALWTVTTAQDWNGGGRHFSADYGYGLIDVYNAVRLAEAWSTLSPVARTSANERSVSSARLTQPVTVRDGTSTFVDFVITEGIIVETVNIDIAMNHSGLDALTLWLIAPDGSRTFIDDLGKTKTLEQQSLSQMFGLTNHRGTLSTGTWTLEIVDRAGDGLAGSLLSGQLTIYGHADTVDNVYHYTSELGAMATLDAQRLVLKDTNGGSDWIDAAAIRDSVAVDLALGKATIDGSHLQIAGVENILGGDGDDYLVGDGAANRLQGMRGNDTLIGALGQDTLVGGRGDDSYYAETSSEIIEIADEGFDTVFAAKTFALGTGLSIEALKTADLAGTQAIDLTGNELNQLLEGNGGDNRLDGRAGADTMRGLGGDDTYCVDNAGDVVEEAEGKGTDRIIARVSYALAPDASIEFLTADPASDTGPIVLTGNRQNQTIEGNSGDNTIDGNGGSDTLVGYGGDDVFIIHSSSDRVVEKANEGYDTIRTAVGYALLSTQYIEVLAALDPTGTTAMSLVGNSLSQLIIGNNGNNILDGLTGADTLIGHGGDDTYYVDNALDIVQEARDAGYDRVVAKTSYALQDNASIESLTAAAGTASINLTGNNLAQAIEGNSGRNILNGGLGQDTLSGGAGSDVFMFSTALGGGNIDRITDFTRSGLAQNDVIGLSSSIFGVLSPGTLPAFRYRQLGTAAVDSTDVILYDRDTGSIFYDADANGYKPAVHFATVTAGTLLSASDFVIYA